MDIAHFIHSLADRRLGFFHLLATMNDIAVNAHVWIFVCVISNVTFSLSVVINFL